MLEVEGVHTQPVWRIIEMFQLCSTMSTQCFYLFLIMFEDQILSAKDCWPDGQLCGTGPTARSS